MGRQGRGQGGEGRVKVAPLVGRQQTSVMTLDEFWFSFRGGLSSEPRLNVMINACYTHS